MPRQKSEEPTKTKRITIRVFPKTKINLLVKLKKKGYSSISEFFSEMIRKFLNN